MWVIPPFLLGKGVIIGQSRSRAINNDSFDCSNDQFLPSVDQRNRRYRSSPSRNGGHFQDDGEESDRRAISLSPASSRKSTGAKSYGSR